MSEEPPISSIYIAPLVLFLIALGVGVVVLTLTLGASSPVQAGVIGTINGQCFECPQGKPGVGEQGPPGVPGRQGDPGPSGATGPEGRQGAQGPSGVAVCLANPACLSGATGPQGVKGDKGDQGPPGFQGPQGAPGAAGPKGETGPSGPSGATGATGPTGPQGPDGVCNCSASNVTFGEVNITQELILGPNTQMVCGANFTMGNSCLLPTQCPNFTLCSLQMQNLQVSGGGPSAFQFGAPTDGVGGVFLAGSSTIANYMLSSFQAFASSLQLVGQGTTVLRSLGGATALIESLGIGAQILLNSVGSVVIQAQGGLINIVSYLNGLTINNLDVTSALNLLSQGNILMQANPMGLGQLMLQSNTIRLTKSLVLDNDTDWFSTQPGFSLYYYLFPPVTNVNAPSMVMHEDVIMRGALIGLNGILEIGPKVALGTGDVFNPNNGAVNLALGTFVNESISLQAPVYNNASLPANYSSLNEGYLWFYDADGTRISGGSVLLDAKQLDVQTYITNTATNTTIIHGNAQITGTLSVASCIGCTSDRRVKEHVAPLRVDESIKRIMSLEPVEYNFVESFRKKDPFVPHTKQHGFIAQEVEEAGFPFAVKEVSNLMQLDKSMLIPDLVKMVQQLQREVSELKSRCK